MVVEQFPDATCQVEFPLLQWTTGGEADAVEREIIDIHEDTLRPPEAVLEFEEKPSRGRRELAKQIEIEQQVAAAGTAETVEGGVPFDPPAPIIINHLPDAADRGQKDAQKLERGEFMFLRFGIVKAVILVTRERQAKQRFTKLGVLRATRFESEMPKHPVGCREQHGVGVAASERGAEESPEHQFIDRLQTGRGTHGDACGLCSSVGHECVLRFKFVRRQLAALNRPECRLQKRELSNPLSLDAGKAVSLERNCFGADGLKLNRSHVRSIRKYGQGNFSSASRSWRRWYSPSLSQSKGLA